MREFEQTLYDSYEPFFHYKGKCTGVSVQDDYEYGRLVIEAVFELYPFKVSNAPESWDLFDSFNFNMDTFQYEGFGGTIPSGEVLTIVNPVQNSCELAVLADRNISVQISKDNRFNAADLYFSVIANKESRVRVPGGKFWSHWNFTGATAQVCIDLYKEYL